MSPALRSLADAVVSLAAAPSQDVEQRPLLNSAPDPYVVVHGGWSYMTATHGDRIAIRRTRDLARLADATEETVWQPPTAGGNARSIWAAELHRLDGRWYIKSSSGAHIFAPGHNAFFEPRRDETWIVYHANRAAGQGCTARRAPHVARVRWNAKGVPQLPLTATELPVPLGD